MRIRKYGSGTHRKGHQHGRSNVSGLLLWWWQLIGKLEKHTTQQELESDRGRKYNGTIRIGDGDESKRIFVIV